MASSNRTRTLLRTPALALPGIIGLAVIACSSASVRGFDVTDTEAGAGSSGSSGESTTGGFSVDGGKEASADGCSDEAKLVYVLSLEGDLYSFAPAAKAFTKVGPLNCKSGNKTFIPISMAVDRNAVAWVNMRESSGFATEDIMFKVDTKTAACTLTSIKGNMGGMGFSTDKGSVDQETLYVVGNGSDQFTPGINRVDFKAQTLVPVHDLTADVDLELTGTGDGRLYAFLIDTPLALAAVDKASAAYSGRVTLTSVPHPLAPMFAFTFWGGDFYFYTATSTAANKSTTVSRYRPSDGSIDNAYMQQIGFHIVGAGVSTCAPTTGPR